MQTKDSKYWRKNDALKYFQMLEELHTMSNVNCVKWNLSQTVFEYFILDVAKESSAVCVVQSNLPSVKEFFLHSFPSWISINLFFHNSNNAKQ